MKKHLIKFLDLVLGYDENDSLISKEGYEILRDPVKRVKLREWIDNYHKTGEWDYSFWDESKHEKLSQHDVIKNEVAVCDHYFPRGKDGRLNRCEFCTEEKQTVL